MAHYRAVGRHFHRAENKLIEQGARYENHYEARRRFLPLAPDDPLRADYQRAAQEGRAFLALAERHGVTESWLLPPVLYLSACAEWSLGHFERAAALFERLQNSHPSYRRPHFMPRDSSPDTRYLSPSRPALAKLIFYARGMAMPAAPRWRRCRSGRSMRTG